MPAQTMASHPYADFLARMQKPGRYLGGEEQSIVKDHAALSCRFVLAFPDLYEIGMSHLGTRILYDLINKSEDLCCERAFSPWADMEAELRARGLPLISLESHTPLRDFDVVGLSLQYELSYSNALLNLELGGLSLRADERGDDEPIVLAGGPTATHGEPLAPFIDLFLVGEAEDVLPDLLRTIGRMRAAKAGRAAILAAAAKMPGIYVPSFYAVAEDPRTGLEVVVGRTPAGVAAGAPERVERIYVRDLDAYPFPTRFPVPYAEAIFDRASVEITRGCTEGCRFCQAGMIYRPVRERRPEDIVDAVLAGTDAGGFDEASLTALSTADVSCIDPLIKALVPELAKRKVSLGIASLRAYGLNESLLDEIKTVGIDGLTFAPEAGTARMRDVINKNVSDEDILTSARRIFERGYGRMKMYFIMGLPTETEVDVVGIVETGRAVREEARTQVREGVITELPQVTISVSQHVPKPHTPFQWAAMDSMEDLDGKVRMLRDLAKRAKLGLKTHDVRESWLECLFARGDRRLGRVLERAYRAGARFDGWKERFDFQLWLDALEAEGVRPEVYTRTLPVGAPLPWSHLDMGFEAGFLEGEYRKALGSRLSPPCGKPAGAKVHHTTEAAAEAERRRLVCYDCGVACDLGEMREERIVALRALSDRAERVLADQAAEEQRAQAQASEGPASALVPLERLRGRVAASNLADDSAFKHNAEAPFSKVRLFFAKVGTLRFMSQLDLVRIIPRMFRRAGVELGFSRGFSPQPRMSFGPAIALGMGGDEEVVDCDVLLERSAEDMAGLLSDDEREAMADVLLERLRPVAPPGMVLLGARLVPSGEKTLGELVAGADFGVALEGLSDAARTGLRARVDELLASEGLTITREQRVKKKRRGRRKQVGSKTVTVDLGPRLLAVEIDEQADLLRFRLRTDLEGVNARPREIAALLAGETVEDHHMRRLRLLARPQKDAEPDTLISLRELGGAWRALERRHDAGARALRDAARAAREALEQEGESATL
ncbi:TIGR03960 family B12-binding radical SAM protein [Pseudenhygromyxa sp. WMMC2535]|uniref:TIGR03960 family B12-binding radical SAM protein n=1 Tax=Pseudenhygromyxa sp. WMMC2535 TaxID=2712867 RepID=UPI0015962C2A|nr:TIGR03960 family B12-binding radical SAM protein [Pseudenhygromyxa sp. WMMC2535]NVB41677.1 TIGR03960 family B12-binding radical SAM protein [Pseudenhygromyxa sp. WMMC2535]